MKKGTKHSIATRLKMRVSQHGKKRPSFTVGHRLRLRAVMYRKGVRQTLKSFTAIITDDRCWVWVGKGNIKNQNGYGKTKRVYSLLVGPVAAGLFLCHRCDNPPCVRPSHLWLGTQTENLRDATNKGRLKRKRREKT